MYQCLICFDTFKKKNTYQCPNDMCNVSICESCLQTWDIMYEKLECPICHTSRMTHDIENQTEQIRMPEEILPGEISLRRNQVYPLSTIGMSSRGRMIFMMTQDNEGMNFIDNYCEYIVNENIRCMMRCCKTMNCIMISICITILLGFIMSNLLYVIEYNGSFENMVNETKDNYTDPSYYLILSINGVCVFLFGFTMITCCLNCKKKC